LALPDYAMSNKHDIVSLRGDRPFSAFFRLGLA
jgi:hypothetical protein